MKRRRLRNRIRLEGGRALKRGGELDGAVALLDVRVDRDGTEAGDLVALELRRRDLERGVVRPRSVLVDVVEVDEFPGVLHDSLAANLVPAEVISLQYRR